MFILHLAMWLLPVIYYNKVISRGYYNSFLIVASKKSIINLKQPYFKCVAKFINALAIIVALLDHTCVIGRKPYAHRK